MRVIHTQDELNCFLKQVQEQREERVTMMVTHPLSATLSDGRFRNLLDLLLPMVQGRSIHLGREHGGDWRITLHLRYRMGVRIADAHGCGDLSPLAPEECEALDKALCIVAEAQQDDPDPLTLARRLFDAARSCAVYENPAMGSPAHRRVVSAASVLIGGCGNCQGFADAYYLLGTLAGLSLRYLAGFKGRAPHLWNLLLLDGRWQTVDVTSGAFLPDAAELSAPGLSTGCL